MKVFENIKEILSSSGGSKGSVATIGNFDGVHIGHRALINTLVREAHSKHLPSVVMTFDPHPLQVLYPGRQTEKIFHRDDQIQEFDKLGVDYLVIEPFTTELAKTDPKDFFKKWIMESLNPAHLVVGYDFSFGANRSGSIPQLMEFSRNCGFELTIISPQKLDGAIVSSSRIRERIRAADFECVTNLLGRNFYLEGTIEKGDQRGRALGIPTSNLKLNAQILPPIAVYLTESIFGGQSFQSLTNVGTNPTFGSNNDLKVETHVLDFDANTYEQPFRVEFLRKLRNEKKFDSSEELKEQIRLDILAAREYFKGK